MLLGQASYPGANFLWHIVDLLRQKRQEAAAKKGRGSFVRASAFMAVHEWSMKTVERPCSGSAISVGNADISNAAAVVRENRTAEFRAVDLRAGPAFVEVCG
jgi:hypothetical protein